MPASTIQAFAIGLAGVDRAGGDKTSQQADDVQAWHYSMHGHVEKYIEKYLKHSALQYVRTFLKQSCV